MAVDLIKLHGEEYARDFEMNESLDRLRRLLGLMNFEPQSVVADFGCGNGMLMELIAHHVQEYVGIDFSQPFIDRANSRKDRLRINNAKFVCAQIEDFCAEHPDYFDIALAMDVSEHVPDDEWTSILASIGSSLKDGGKVYIHTPNAEFFIEKLKARNLLIKQFEQHVAVRTAGQNSAILHRAGFSRVGVAFLPHYNFLKFLHPISFLPGLGKYFQARLFLTGEK